MMEGDWPIMHNNRKFDYSIFDNLAHGDKKVLLFVMYFGKPFSDLRWDRPVVKRQWGLLSVYRSRSGLWFGSNG